MPYKIWLHIEHCLPSKDIYEDIGLPEELGEFDRLRQAEKFAEQVKDIAESLLCSKGVPNGV